MKPYISYDDDNVLPYLVFQKMLDSLYLVYIAWFYSLMALLYNMMVSEMLHLRNFDQRHCLELVRIYPEKCIRERLKNKKCSLVKECFVYYIFHNFPTISYVCVFTRDVIPISNATS